MRKARQIAIILPDTLQSIGLQDLLADYFPPVEISCYSSFEQLMAGDGDNFDFYFTRPDIFVLNADYFLPRKAKTMLLIDCDAKTAAGHYLDIRASQETIIENLQHLFATDIDHLDNEHGKDLSLREVDVLKLIVQGSTNKDIADKLNISLNTVLSHRKNITAKLGIKTVSGLTFYAIMNGLVSADLIG